MLGNTLAGRYQIISNLGGGGFGETYVACDTQLPGTPQCVVKKLKPQSHDPHTLQTARRLFDTEAQVLYQLGNYQYIPQLLAYFEENQEFYLVQEFIEGNDLSHELTPGKVFTQAAVISLLQEILEILEFVHQQKVIHRDINPRNLLRHKIDNKLVLIDFGAVKQITTNFVTSQIPKITVAIGTPGYIPSEQAMGNPKLSSDIYAVGIIGIQALTGLSPEQFEHDADSNEIIWQHQANVTPEFAEIIDKMVKYDFRDRFISAREALQAIKDFSCGSNSSSATLALAPAPALVANHQSGNISSANIKLFHPINPKVIAIKALTGITLIGTIATAGFFILDAINSTNSAALYKQANTLYDLQRYEDALNTYEQALEIRDDYADAWNGKGKALYELKKYQDALVAYDKSIQLQPGLFLAWRGRGFTLAKLERYQEAISSYNKALEIQADDAEIWNAKGEVFSQLKQYDDAIQSYDKAVELKSDYPQSWYNKGKLFHALKRYEDAIKSYDKAIEYQPSYQNAWYDKGNALVNLQRHQDAFNAYDKAVQIKSDFYPAWFSRGNVLLKMGRYVEAIDSFKEVTKYNPNNYQAWYSQGWALHQQQRYEEAVDSFNKATAIKRNDFQVWYSRGNSLYNLKRYEEAISSYNRAVNYKPDHYESWYSRGNAFLNLQLFPEAIKSYEQAIKIKLDFQPAINALNQAQAQLTIPKDTTKPEQIKKEDSGVTSNPQNN
ncbi:tetratricopeptide repeat protein [Calothrix sp. UHCC 0171]|uniref:tetratricopeptide repeat protein n=1 Tax=Calothrix sp. UHCC 0171 TaxID=3110245 RepID=UPI002B2042B1|nr:tetratricopeptide repeat protein [Calothrix sp. UHCC 0171]MEA5569658.1 tetratricopeptide repeat protein [Calothrix sp. UHCC 0171]